MTDSETEILDPAAQLRADIESAIEEQQTTGLEPGAKPAAPKGVAPAAQEATEAPAPRGDGRDEKGRFAPKETGVSVENAPEKAEGSQLAIDAADAGKEALRPPPGFSVASKTLWDSLPQPVRDDIAKREQEVDAGFRRYGGLGKIAEEAERNGTTLQAAVNDYIGVETALRQDFIGGVEHICHIMGVDPRALVQVMALRYEPRTNSTGATAPTGAAPPQLQPQALDPMAIASHVADVLRGETEQRELSAKIASFAADPKNRFFANLRHDMAQIVQAGKADNLEQAYDAACWLHPEIRAILINETNGARDKEAAAAISRSRNAAKAVGGPPAPGINPDTAAKRHNLNLEDEIRAAIDAQLGA